MELTTWNLPVLALRGLTVFPHMTLTFDVERPISIAALERAMEADQDIFLVTQREIGVNAPEEKDLYTIGTVSHITQILRLGQSSVRVMVEGRQRAHLRRLWQTEPFLQANVEAIPEEPSSEAMRKSPRTEALLRQTYALFGEYAEQASGVPEEVVATVMDSRDPGFLADYIAQNIALRYTDKQEILEEFSPFARLRKLNGFLVRENNVLGFEHEMESKVRDQLVRTQRDQILRTQIRVLQNELGETDDGDEDEIESYRQEILALELPEETEQHLLKEVNKLAKQPFGSAEGAVIRNYLDVCLEMPWNTTTKERVSVDAARWYFNSKPDTQMEFDLGLAVREDSENPIYYVEYAHARICSLVRALAADGIAVPETADLSLLSGEAEKALIKQMAQFCEEIKLAARDYDPSHINRCLQELAGCFHRFYTACRIRGEEPQVAAARLKLADDARAVLKNGLKLIGVDAPEKM